MSASPTVTYSEMRDNLVALRVIDVPIKPVLETAIAAWLTRAYKEMLEAINPQEAIVTVNDVTCDDGKVLWSAVERASNMSFYSDDPRPASSVAYQIAVKDPNADGVWLETTLSTVTVQYVPRAPRFTSELVDADATYDEGWRVWDREDTGEIYEALVDAAPGDELDDETKWAVVPILYVLSDAAQELALSFWHAKDKQYDEAQYHAAQAENLKGVLFLREQSRR